MAFNPDQPRIPKGYPGAGRFIKVGTMLAPTTLNATRRRELLKNPFARSENAGPEHKSPFIMGGPESSPMVTAVPRRPRPASAGDVAERGRLTKPRQQRPATAKTKTEVRASVAKRAAGSRSGWVDLADVRDDLAAKGYNREQQDATLKAMMSDPDVRIIPVANVKSLTPRDRNAALELTPGPGGQMHMIQIGGDPELNTKASAGPTLGELRDDLADAERRLKFAEDEGEPTAGLRAHIADLRGRIQNLNGSGSGSRAAQIAERLPSAQSREQAYAMLDGLSVAELRDVAKGQRVPVAAKANKTQLRDAIVRLLVGVRLDGDAIRRNARG